LSSFSKFYQSVRALLPTIFILTVTVSAVAQSSVLQNEPSVPDNTMARIERARALAAAHQLGAAAGELETVRGSVKDAALRNITTLMLIGIYLEEANYVRPVALLDETFQARSTKKDETVRAYFAVAGQTINGVRSRIARYRSFGINVSDRNLPVEALKDLDHMRFLLERLIAQANELTKDNGRAYDAWALKEDVLGIRLSLARDEEDRNKWHTEYVGAREKLASRQIQIASIGRPPALEAVTAKIPNPFAGPKPSGSPETTSTQSNSPSPSPIATPEASVKRDQQAETANTMTSPAATSTPAATQPANGTEPKTVSMGSLNGRQLKRQVPSYPAQAKAAGVSGTVRVFILVDETGKVSVTGSEGPDLLRGAAEAAARGWLFEPFIVDGQTVRVSAYIEFDFKQ
jgi:TonB family protein